jgi:hypothetical protein
MKNLNFIDLKNTALSALICFLTISCERELSADATLSKYSSTAEVFTDFPVGMGTSFYFPYAGGPDNPIGSKLNAWTVDQTESYEGTASMRFDVPTDTDPTGNYAGGIFRIDGAGRDLTGYDSLTFWAKASQGVTISEIGFGEDFNTFSGNKYIATMKNVSLGTNWTKYIIPIPDASKLLQERGMLRYAANSVSTNGKAYVFWIDELKFEKLGTIARPQPKIMNGLAAIQQGSIDSKINVTGLSQTFNMASGFNQTVSTAPYYFNFESSDPTVASVNEKGVVSILKIGTATISASLNNIAATGSLKINVGAAFVNATNPTLPQANVISVFSDAYPTLAGFNPGFFAGANTTNITIPVYANNNHLSYNTVDFVGIGWTGTINASSKTMLHLDVQLKSVSSNLRIELKDFGPDNLDNGFGANGDTAGGFILTNQLIKDSWVSINIPLSSFTLPTGGGGSGNPNKNNLGFVIFVSNNAASFLVDNIYFY